MSKRRGRRRGKQKKKRTNTSSLNQHHREKKTLLPPLMRLPGGGLTNPSPWIDDRLPELLWACLIISAIPRERALAIFRSIAEIGFNYRDSDETAEWRLYLSDFPNYPEELLQQLIEIVARDPLGYASLRPLLLFDTLPGKEQWVKLLSVEPQNDDWNTLSNAVLVTLDHQSQEATDVRWLSLLFKIALGRVVFPETMKDKAEEIIHYPNRGDMRSVRPSIRSMELFIGMPHKEDALPNSWPSDFWSEGFSRTDCIPAEKPRSVGEKHDVVKTFDSLRLAINTLIEHWFNTVQTTAIDARHDGSFGLCFFAIAALTEMLLGRNAYGITGRALIRTLVETRITLAYLKVKDDVELWKKYRTFGVGQAKLALLKLDNIEDHPDFTAPDVLESLSNEDYFQEFVAIDLGHWCGLDLRKMAEISKTKDDYDRFYGWSSTFVHGHWGAVRDTTMLHCLNPLHRLHRIPMSGHRMLESCAKDGIELINTMIQDLSELYPDISVTIELVYRQSSNESEEKS